MGLQQHVNEPTQESGHTLDLIITRQCDSLLANIPTLIYEREAGELKENGVDLEVSVICLNLKRRGTLQPT